MARILAQVEGWSLLHSYKGQFVWIDHHCGWPMAAPADHFVVTEDSLACSACGKVTPTEIEAMYRTAKMGLPQRTPKTYSYMTSEDSFLMIPK